MKNILLLSSTLLCTLITGCGEEFTTVNIGNQEFTDISTTSFQTQNGHEFGIINLAAPHKGFCHVTVKSDEFSSKSDKLLSQSNNEKDLSVACNWGEHYFVQSKRYKTSTKISLTNKIKGDHSGEFSLSFKLVNVESEQYLELKDLRTQLPENIILKFIHH